MTEDLPFGLFYPFTATVTFGAEVVFARVRFQSGGVTKVVPGPSQRWWYTAPL